MRSPKLPEARFIDDKGDTKIVQLVRPYAPLKQGNIAYDPAYHEHKTFCLHCTAPMRVQKGHLSVGGNSGAQTHARFTPVKKHDDGCEDSLKLQRPKRIRIDRKKGYLINVNSRGFSEEFHTAAGAHDVSEKGAILSTHPDLKDREAHTVDGLKGLVEFMKDCDPARLRTAKIVFENKAIDWDDFCVYAAKPDRVAKLLDRAKELPKGKTVLCLMEVFTDKAHYIKPFAKAHERKVRASPLLHDIDRRGAYRDFLPSFFLKEYRNTAVTNAFMQAGGYVVLALFSVNARTGRDRNTKIYLDADIVSGDQVMRHTMKEIFQMSLDAAAAKKAARAKPPVPAPV
jgi:hypothetical protein